MSKSQKKKRPTNRAAQDLAAKPWISMKSGLRVIWITSILMAVLTIWEVTPERGILQGLLWGGIFGLLIWLIFWGYYFLRRILH